MGTENKPALGKSEQAVFDFLKSSGPSSSQAIGDALYAKTSSCAHLGGGTGSMGGRNSPQDIRRSWASKLLNSLKVKGYLHFDSNGNQKIWSINQDSPKSDSPQNSSQNSPQNPPLNNPLSHPATVPAKRNAKKRTTPTIPYRKRFESWKKSTCPYCNGTVISRVETKDIEGGKITGIHFKCLNSECNAENFFSSKRLNLED